MRVNRAQVASARDWLRLPRALIDDSDVTTSVKLPLRFDADVQELAIEPLERVFPQTAELSTKVERGVVFGVVRSAAIEIDDVTRER